MSEYSACCGTLCTPHRDQTWYRISLNSGRVLYNSCPALGLSQTLVYTVQVANVECIPVPTRTTTPTPTATPCTGLVPLPITGTSVTYRGVTLTATGSGNVRYSLGNFTVNCNGYTTIQNVDLNLGLSFGLPIPIPSFYYELAFSTPVNNITLSFDQGDLGDVLLLNTNSGVPDLITLRSCSQLTVTNNQIVFLGGGTSGFPSGGILFQVSANTSYTNLIISGTNQFNGGTGNGGPIRIDCCSIIGNAPCSYQATPTNTPTHTSTPTQTESPGIIHGRTLFMKMRKGI